MEALPILYSKGKNGAILTWRVFLEGAVVVQEYGQMGGKQQQSRREAKGKNIGRSNETTPEMQAALEAKSVWTKKRDRKYAESVDLLNNRPLLAMLAKNDKWQDSKKRVKYPAILQPKLDGNRSLSRNKDGAVLLTSREGVPQEFLPHINAQLAGMLPDDMVLDGELYCHGVNLQTINSWVKKNRPESMQIKLHLYDMPEVPGMEDPIQKDRIEALEKFFAEKLSNLDHVVLVPSHIVNSEEEVDYWNGYYVGLGYEGVMVRNMDATYEHGHRSGDLIKVKSFEDAEFKVVGFTNGEGSYSDCVKWNCVTKDGIEFDVNPCGKLEQKREWLRDGQQYIGKMLTVRYMGFTERGIPKIATGVAFRLDGDLPTEKAA
jgi:ATP-dependent DNA ligase